jgi:hypothetical protein
MSTQATDASLQDILTVVETGAPLTDKQRHMLVAHVRCLHEYSDRLHEIATRRAMLEPPPPLRLVHPNKVYVVISEESDRRRLVRAFGCQIQALQYAADLERGPLDPRPGEEPRPKYSVEPCEVRHDPSELIPAWLQSARASAG